MSNEEYEFTPAVKVLVLQFGLLAGSGSVLLGYIAIDPSRFGDPQIGQIILAVVGFLLAIALLRILVRILILRKTRYIVTPQKLHREYELLYKRRTREVPLSQLRGMELEQGRLQSLFGFGTLTFLTAGTNQSLGFLEFEHINLPEETRNKIRDVVSMYET
jgi:membrane protein YdbS with pleckstrin-like domain